MNDTEVQIVWGTGNFSNPLCGVVSHLAALENCISVDLFSVPCNDYVAIAIFMGCQNWRIKHGCNVSGSNEYLVEMESKILP